MLDYALAKYCKSCRGTLEFTRNMHLQNCPSCKRQLEEVKLCNLCGSGTPQPKSNTSCSRCGKHWQSGGWEKSPMDY